MARANASNPSSLPRARARHLRQRRKHARGIHPLSTDRAHRLQQTRFRGVRELQLFVEFRSRHRRPRRRPRVRLSGQRFRRAIILAPRLARRACHRRVTSFGVLHELSARVLVLRVVLPALALAAGSFFPPSRRIHRVRAHRRQRRSRTTARRGDDARDHLLALAVADDGHGRSQPLASRRRRHRVLGVEMNRRVLARARRRRGARRAARERRASTRARFLRAELGEEIGGHVRRASCRSLARFPRLELAARARARWRRRARRRATTGGASRASPRACS